MSHLHLALCKFATVRLFVEPWHVADLQPGVGLHEIVAELLTERSTTGLPEAWRGDYSVDRARVWVEERDAESPTLLVSERTSGRAIGLVIVHDIPLGGSAVDVRIGYLIAEDTWGRGFATELVGGLVDWARSQPLVETVTGGVDTANEASVRVLVKNGFERIAVSDDGEATYQLQVGPS